MHTLRGLRRAIGIGRGNSEPPPFTVSFTGLSTDTLGAFGEIGEHASISYTITPDLGTETVKWSDSSNPADAATYGTGANPTDFAASEGGFVYLHVTDDPGEGAVTRTFAFAARFPAVAPTFSVQPSFLSDAASVPIQMDYGTATGGDIEIETLTFNGADIISRIVDTDGEDNPIGPRADVSDLFVYGQTNTIAMRTRAFNQFGETLSDTVSETVINVPAAMAAPVVTAVDSTTISVDRAAAPDTGGSAITSYDLRWTTDINFDPVQWTLVEGITDPQEVAGFFPSQQVWVQTRANNAAGPGEFSPEDDATTDAGVPAVNPAYELLNFVAGGGGTADLLRVDGFSYSGADTVDFFGITSSSVTAPSKADIVAGTGTGSLEEFSVLDVDLTTLDVALSGLTATSNGAPYVHGYLAERNNGGSSLVRTATITSTLDFTLPTLVSATTNIEGTQTTLTFSEAVFGTAVVGNWTLDEDTVPVSVSDVSIPGSTIVVLTHATLTAGTTLTISYSGGNVRDAKANALATITDAAITNNVPASAWSITAGDASATINTFPNVPTTPAWSITAGDASATITSYPGQV